MLVSGEERLIKPDPRFFRLLLDRFGLAPEATFYVDDSEANVEAAGSASTPSASPARGKRFGEAGGAPSVRSTRSQCSAMTRKLSPMSSATARWPGRSGRAWSRATIASVSST